MHSNDPQEGQCMKMNESHKMLCIKSHIKKIYSSIHIKLKKQAKINTVLVQGQEESVANDWKGSGMI